MANDQNWYTGVFKSWQVKLLGPKPTSEQLASVHNLKAKPGKQALATAMALRDCGVTNPQIMIACGNPQLNKMKGFVTDALLKRIPVPPTAEGHKVYKLEITPKGRQRIARSEQADQKLDAAGKVVEADEKQPAKRPSKAKGAPKAKAKAKVSEADVRLSEGRALAAKAKPKAKAETVTSETASAVETVPAPQPAVDENQQA